MLWVAPTEHDLQSLLRETKHPWRISTLPEQHGCDILIPTRRGIVGFQRKTLPDLLSSLQDGRLYYSLNQLRTSATVTHSFLLVESRFTLTTDGTHYTEADISVKTLNTIIAKFSLFNVSYIPTYSLAGTLAACIDIPRYISTDESTTLHRPKNVRNEWGQTSNETYGVFLLQSFPGIGPKVATAIYRHFNGVPISWSVTADDLARVPGVGKVRATALLEAVRPPGGFPPDPPQSPSEAAAGAPGPPVPESRP